MAETGFDGLAAALQRSVLGALLAAVALLVGVYSLDVIQRQDPLLVLAGAVGILVAFGASMWIGYLFVDGYRDR
ncbi:hypothetical protein KTS45_12840 [Halomicroarcula limicola]|uniref:Uncharacterized protein n=1 Tax=Haloarcula limicola TaxID=1429915 RepID=A0A8J7YAV3_9EURY|nr:hypothetical protein [Halomicroarcula limicola]MBV0925083.1 hypothetical protein [Halomicroarcula limicola]